MRIDSTLHDAAFRLGLAAELDSAMDTIMIEYRAIEVSEKLDRNQKQQLLKCLDVSLAVLKKAMTKYFVEAMKHWKLYEEQNGIPSNT